MSVNMPNRDSLSARPASRWLTPVCVIALTANGYALEPAPQRTIVFNRDIRPLLSDRCFACHGPDEEQRASGLRLDEFAGAVEDRGGYQAVKPGVPDESEIISRITTADADLRMPPDEHGKPLTEADVELLKAWVAQGAEYQEHWSFTPVIRPDIPAVNEHQWVANAIDAFVLDGLRETELTHNPPADPRTLVRRLAFDLTGLPADEALVAKYVSSPTEETYREIVEQLLASPHHGERMAMYWLDLVRYADTLGFHGDQDRSVWPYRDYVINAFNENKPFDQFTVEQLAGDLLPDATLSQRVASTYNRLNRASGEGGVQPKEYLAKYSADRVRTAGAVWLGTTFGCAECHDHKFDPYTMKDFYSFAAFFADIKEQGIVAGANHIALLPVPSKEQQRRATELDAQLANTRQQIDALTKEHAAQIERWTAELHAQNELWQALTPTSATSIGGATLAVQPDGTILASGINPDKDVHELSFAPQASRIGAIKLELLPHDSLPNRGPGRAGNGNLVIHKIELRQGDRVVQWSRAIANHSQVNHAAEYVINGKPNGWAILPRTGQPNQIVLMASQALEIKADGGPVTVRIEQNHGASHGIGHYRLVFTEKSETELPPGVVEPGLLEIAAKPADGRSGPEQQRLVEAYRNATPAFADILQQLNAATEAKRVLEASIPTTLGTTATEPREMRVLPRGNWMDDTGQVVLPAVPEFLKLNGVAEQDNQARLNRLDLARWMTDARNPLVARAFVNRLWMLLFGAGLSRSVDDLGSQGEWPTHPELLDWLADEFVASGWDVRHMLRLMLYSNTYRQSSLPTAEHMANDPYNRLLARQGRWRLEAEMVRDNALVVSGLLARRVGGPSVKPYQPAGYWDQLNFPRRTYQNDGGESQYRRGVYTHWQRTFLHPSMLAFDAPPREECTARRSRSNTPLQSLVLLNDPSYVEAAKALAVEMLQTCPTDDADARLNWLYAQVLAREPNANETEILKNLVTQSRNEFAAEPERAKQLLGTGQYAVPAELNAADVATWMAATRAVLNLHETITRY